MLNNGFKIQQKTFVSCTRVTLYLTKNSIIDTLKKLTLLAAVSSIAIAFYLPIDLLEEEDQPMQEIANKKAEESGTPFINFFRMEEIEKIAEQIGLKDIKPVSTQNMREIYISKIELTTFYQQAVNFS